MTRFIIRDDICDPEIFFELRVFFESFARVLHNAGGYAFVTQIEELWPKGNKNFICKMVEAKIIKLTKYNNQCDFVYLTEASLKFIKYADSVQNFEGVHKNLFSVNTLSPNPSHKQLFSSALKFSQLAQESASHSVTMIGRVEYREYIEEVITQYGRRLFPDYQTDLPPKAAFGGFFNKSDYTQYLETIPFIKRSLKSIFDSTKCVLVPKFEDIPTVDLDLLKVTVEFIIFDIGIEKEIRDYVVTAFKLMQIMNQGIKDRIVKFIVYTYSEQRKQLILKNFNEWFIKTENITRLKEKNGWKYTQIKFELEPKNFHIDLTVGKIMKAKRISPNRRQIAKTPENLNLKAKESIGRFNDPTELAKFHERLKDKKLKLKHKK